MSSERQITGNACEEKTAYEERTAAAPPRELSDDALLVRLLALAGQSRGAEVELLRHLGEVDARRLYAREACPSMFVYCTSVLHFSEAEAYLRITAARAARQRPAILPMLADGRLHLSAIARVAPRLTEDNAEAVLARAVHRSKREILELVAELAPRPDARASVRALPPRGAGREIRDATRTEPARPVADSGPSGIDGGGAPAPLRGIVASADTSRAPEALASGAASAPTAAQPTAVQPSVVQPSGAPLGAAEPRAPEPRIPQPRAAVVEPLSPGRYRVQFTADHGLRDKLERLGQLLGVAERDLARVIDAAVTEKLQRLESRRSAQSTRPRQTLEAADTRARNRHVPAVVRRAVYLRDGGQCRFVDRRGRRCPARHGLELHHRRPFAMGGDHAVENLRLMCRAHNRYIGEIDFGRELAIPSRRAAREAGEGARGRSREGGGSSRLAPRRVVSTLSGQSRLS